MKRSLKLFKTKTIVFISILSTLFYFGCSKLDISPESNRTNKKFSPSDFFATKTSITPATKKVIDFLKFRNGNKEFVTEFAKSNGYAVWNKSLEASVPHKGNGLYQASFANTSNNNNDTIVYIPLVLNGDSTVNGFIRATINDSISVSFSLAQDYKNYSFNSSGENMSEATKFAFFMIYLNREVFDNMVYDISDPRLFSTDTIGRKTRKIFFSEPHNSTSNLEDFVEICETVNVQWVNCKYVGYPECTPACDQCGKCMSTAQIETCVTVYVGSGSGGSGSTGTSGSGSGGIPHIYPCDPTIIPANFGVLPGSPLPPCPAPTGGTGWTPPTIPTGVNHDGYYYSRIWQLDSLMSNPFAAIPCDSLNLLNTFGPMFQSVSNHKVPTSVLTRLDSIKSATPNFDTSRLFVQTLNNAAGSVVNCDFFPLKISQLPIKNIQTGQRFTPSEFLEYFRKNINQFSTNNVIFAPYNSNGFNDILQNQKDSVNSLGAIMHIDMQQDGSVIVSGYQNSYSPNYVSLNFTFSTLVTPLDGYHPVSGNRRFGIYTDVNGGYTFYTLGVDRISRTIFAQGDRVLSLFTSNGFEKADLIWNGMQSKLINFITDNNGAASLYTRPDYKIRPKWNDIEDFLKGTITFDSLKIKLCP